MDSREYLNDIRNTRYTAEGKRMAAEEAAEALDLLHSLQPGSRGGGPHDRLAELVVRYDALLEDFTIDFERYTALLEQAGAMLDRARDILRDGRAHAIDMNHVEVVHRYYLLGHSRGKIAHDMGYSLARVDERKRQCLDWLDHARDGDGYPLVPIVSE